MKRNHTIVAGLAGTLSLVVITAFAAGPGPGPGMGMGTMHGMGPGVGPMGGMGMLHGAGPGMMAAQNMDQVKATLAITSEQEPAWQAYVAKVEEQFALMQAMHAQRFQPAEPGTAAPDRMSQHLSLMSQRLAGMQGVSAALKDLYAVLTPEQRTLADQQFGHMGPRAQGGPQGRGGFGPCTTG